MNNSIPFCALKRDDDVSGLREQLKAGIDQASPAICQAISIILTEEQRSRFFSASCRKLLKEATDGQPVSV